MNLTKEVKDILINKFPKLKGKSDSYILGFAKALSNAMNPIKVDPNGGSAAPGTPSDEFQLPQRVEGEMDSDSNNKSKQKDFGYKQFKNKSQQKDQDTDPSDDKSKSNSTDNKEEQEKTKELDKEETTGKGKEETKGKEQGKLKNKKPNLGDKGYKDIQDLEDEKRRAQVEKEKAEGTYPKDLKDLSFEERAKAIKDIMLDPKTKGNILGDINKIKDQEYSKKQESEAKKYQASPLRSFVVDLNRFIKSLIDPKKEDTWSKPNKTYYGSGVLRPGRAKSFEKNIPLINVYYDQSGSWSADDIAVGNRALATLADLQRQGKIKIKIYYFSDIVTDNINDRRLHGGTGALPEIVDHIKETGADNVIVLTDSDTDYSRDAGTVTIPGAFYLLWRNNRPSTIFDKIKSKKHIAVYNLTNE